MIKYRPIVDNRLDKWYTHYSMKEINPIAEGQQELFSDVKEGRFTSIKVGWSHKKFEGSHYDAPPIPTSRDKFSHDPETGEDSPNDLKIISKAINSNISRRQFLIGAGLLAGSGALGFLGNRMLPSLEGIISPEQKAKDGKMVLGAEETILQKEMVRVLNWVPDGPITFWTTAAGKRRYLLTGGQNNATYMLETDGTKTLYEEIKTSNLKKSDFAEVYSPDENIEYKKHYVGITSVWQMDKNKPDSLFGIVHCEQRVDRNASGTFTATIELVKSEDAGSTWESLGPIIKGDEPQEPGERASGAGQPTAIYNENDGYAYILYIDWAAGKKVKHPDQIYLARIKPNAAGESTMLQYFTEDGFGIADEKTPLKSVIPVPEGENFVYTALPDVSWNEKLGQYICTGECDKGFWFAKSKNLIDWSKPEIVYDFTERGGKPHSILQVGEKWDSYPTALDETKANSDITGENGLFYHSSGDNVISHEPAVLEFEIH